MRSPIRHREDRHSGELTAGELGHSQYGTPLKEILHAYPHEDKQKWIIVPTNWADTGGRCSGPDQWAAEWAPDLWAAWLDSNPEAEQPEPDVVQRTTLELERYAERFGGDDPTQPFEVMTYIYIPDPRKFAMPLHVWVDDRPGLTVEQATADEDAIDPPVVEDFTTDALGVGRKTTCHGVLDAQPGDLPGTQGVWVTVRYAFAVPNRQAVLTVKATETDPARMTAASSDIDDFVRGVTLSYAGGAPFTLDDGGSA